MKKVLIYLTLMLLSFFAGVTYKQLDFVYNNIYDLNEPIPLVSDGKEHGTLPKGAELHYQSEDRGMVDFYVFVRIPEEKVKSIITKSESDHYYGIKRLSGG